ncbi:techylectin-like protein [Physella acuta]|uniref:techylectin-like protein n=1 Tax=Physella acuta TaxID=109671 RepID=UPI0027DCCB17|nr:techylectin-like protein [Physella acuta]
MAVDRYIVVVDPQIVQYIVVVDPQIVQYIVVVDPQIVQLTVDQYIVVVDPQIVQYIVVVDPQLVQLTVIVISCEVVDYDYVRLDRRSVNILPLNERHTTGSVMSCAARCVDSTSDCRNLMYDETTGVCILGHWILPKDSVNESVPQPSAESTLFSLGKFCQVNETVNFIGNGRMGSCNTAACLEQQNIARKNSNVLYDPAIYKSCSDVKNSSNPRQLLQLSSGLVVMCDTVTDGGGWTIFQRRVSGVVDFYRNWEEYKHGFGDFDAGEFYLGNENIYCLSNNKTYEMRIDMTYLGNSYFASYSSFKFYPETDFYKMAVYGFYGNTSDAHSLINNERWFGTYDKSYDTTGTWCAEFCHGAWWYNGGCGYTHLNGVYGSRQYKSGIQWWYLTDFYSSLNSTEMKIRAKPV